VIPFSKKNIEGDEGGAKVMWVNNRFVLKKAAT
jgi:hypothetical protein